MEKAAHICYDIMAYRCNYLKSFTIVFLKYAFKLSLCVKFHGTVYAGKNARSIPRQKSTRHKLQLYLSSVM